MPASEGDVRVDAGGGTRAELKDVPCPRCESTNTKFCYYNNYNLSQPRHFCKSCRRYWTRGGTLRNIPYGGARRKNSRRPPQPFPSLSSSVPQRPPTQVVQPPSPLTLAPDASVACESSGGMGSPLNLRDEEPLAGLSFSSLLGVGGVASSNYMMDGPAAVGGGGTGGSGCSLGGFDGCCSGLSSDAGDFFSWFDPADTTFLAGLEL